MSVRAEAARAPGGTRDAERGRGLFERPSCYDAINERRNCGVDFIMNRLTKVRRLSLDLAKRQWMRFGVTGIAVALALICGGSSCSSTSPGGVDSGATGGAAGTGGGSGNGGGTGGSGGAGTAGAGGTGGSGGGTAGAAGGAAGSRGGAGGAAGAAAGTGGSRGGAGGTAGGAGNGAAGAGGAGAGTCNGQTCQSDEFCCGPPACGECKKILTGPNCPTSC
jgi:hypothetical protein